MRPRTLLDKDKVKIRLLEKYTIDPITNCWNWDGGLVDGYGRIMIARIFYGVHRLSAWIYKDFDLSSNLLICHHCDNPKCFNPEHLFVGTHQDNISDMIQKHRSKVRTNFRNNVHKLEEFQVLEILEKRKNGKSISELKDEYNVSYSCIQAVCAGKHCKRFKLGV